MRPRSLSRPVTGNPKDIVVADDVIVIVIPTHDFAQGLQEMRPGDILVSYLEDLALLDALERTVIPQ